MLLVLQSVARINDSEKRGVSDREIREIARRAGMDPRGMAGYHAAKLIEKREDGGRWLSPGGRERLVALSSAHSLDTGESLLRSDGPRNEEQ